ncbi:MAG TPA: phasin family protein [Xanthobacteraceae bacterium]|nr:phasin family protein [Xanthobacteraceae bacterium]
MSNDLTTEIKAAFEKMNALTENFTSVIKNASTAPLQAAGEYNSKLLEFTLANSKAAFDFAQKLTSVKSPSEFLELTTKQTREHSEVLTKQSKELLAIVEKAMQKKPEI